MCPAVGGNGGGEQRRVSEGLEWERPHLLTIASAFLVSLARSVDVVSLYPSGPKLFFIVRPDRGGAIAGGIARNAQARITYGSNEDMEAAAAVVSDHR
jgi:hypothetical protein